MIELDVEPRRAAAAVDDDPLSNYLVLGDFGAAPGAAPPEAAEAANPRASAPIAIGRDNFDGVISRMNVSLAGTPIRELDDLHPDRLFQRLPLFGEWTAEVPGLQESSTRPDPPKPDVEELLRPSTLLEQIAEGGDPFQKYLRELTRAHAAPKDAANPARDPARIAQMSERMRGLLHHPKFQTIESAWRGVDFVVRGTGSDDAPGGGAHLFVAQYSREDAANDLCAAASLRRTRIFELLQARKWRAIVGLYSFGPVAADIELLGRLALLASHVRAPFLAEGSADMGPHWSELTSIPEASYIGLALPRFLLRLPYGARTSSIDSFAFEEMPGDPVHPHYLWGNPALACLALLAGGRETLNLRGLPLHTYQKDGEWTMTPCAELLMTEGHVLALIEMGMMPLVSFAESDRVRLAGFRAINGEELPLA